MTAEYIMKYEFCSLNETEKKDEKGMKKKRATRLSKTNSILVCNSIFPSMKWYIYMYCVRSQAIMWNQCDAHFVRFTFFAFYWNWGRFQWGHRMIQRNVYVCVCQTHNDLSSFFRYMVSVWQESMHDPFKLLYIQRDICSSQCERNESKWVTAAIKKKREKRWEKTYWNNIIFM